MAQTGRGAIEGPIKVPGTACQDSMFTVFDKLGDVKGPYAQMPVRGYLGFQPAGAAAVRPDGTPVVSTGGPFDIWANSFIAKIDAQLWPSGSSWPIIWHLRIFLLYGVNVFWWTMGWLADQLIILQSLPDVPNKGGLRNVLADFAQKALIGKFTGADVQWASQVDVYARNYYCPTLIVSAADAISLHLHNIFDEQEMIDHASANALCPQHAQLLFSDRQTRLGAAEYTELYRRDYVGEPIWKKKMREIGFIDEDLVRYVDALRDWWPDENVVIDWMRKGVLDPAIIGAQGLDTGFGDAYTDQAKKWSYRNGVKLEDAHRLWREQWEPVDVQTGYALLHRASAGLAGDKINFSEEDLKRNIKLSRIAPAYRDALYAARWERLGRRQIKALYDDYIVNEQDLENYLVAGGMIREDAQLQVADWQKLRPLYTRRLVGGTGPGGLMAEFAAGTIGTSEYLQELSELGFNGQEQQIALAEARAVRERKTRGQLITWLHARYIKGDVLDTAAQAAMASFGLDAEDVGNLLRLWRVELEVMPKEPSVAELLDWQCKGIISDGELVSRLSQMRYAAEDIANMVAVNELKCAQHFVAQAGKYVQNTDRKLNTAEAYWRKLIAQAQKNFGSVKQRTQTPAGKLLSMVKHDLEAAPPPAKSLAGRAAAVLAKAGANGASQSQSATVAGGAGQASSAIPGADNAGTNATVADGATVPEAPSTTESTVTGATSPMPAPLYSPAQEPPYSPPEPQSGQ